MSHLDVKLKDVAPNLIMSCHPVYSRVKTLKQNGCHAPFFSDYSSMNKCLLMHDCNLALMQYHRQLQNLLVHELFDVASAKIMCVVILSFV